MKGLEFRSFVTTALFVFLLSRYGLDLNFITLALLTVALLIMIIRDFETYIMPDSTTVAVFLLGITHHYLFAASWADYLSGFAVCLIVAATRSILRECVAARRSCCMFAA